MRRIELLTGSRRGLRRGLLLSVAPAMLSAKSGVAPYSTQSRGANRGTHRIVTEAAQGTISVRPATNNQNIAENRKNNKGTTDHKKLVEYKYKTP